MSRMPERDLTLDAWISAPVVRTRHARRARADAAALWDCASRVRLADTGHLGRLVRWRIPGLDPELTYRDLFRGYPFTVLEEGDQRQVSGLCGRIWTLARDYPRLDGPDEFRGWSRRDTVRVLFAHWAREHPDGGSELISETRVEPTDRVAALRLRALWSVVGPFQRLVGAEPLALAAREAEGAGARRPSDELRP
jgi:hypothetical protein